jgi:outer membrane protein assembly factor BamD (BamD/ComL family)
VLMYKKAKDSDLLEDYDQYAIEYPDGQFIHQVNDRREVLTLARNKREMTPERYREYLEQYATSKNSIGAYTLYITEFPEGEETKRIQKIREDLIYKRAREVNTITAYEAYLQEFPEGRYKKVAEKQIENLRYAW